MNNRKYKLLMVFGLFLLFQIGNYVYAASDKEIFSAAYKKAYEEKNAEEALTLLGEILTEYPTSDLCDDAQWTIVSFYPRLIPDYKKGIEEAQKLLERFPNSKWADHAMRKIIDLTYHYEKNHDKTIELIKEFLKKYPNSQFVEEQTYQMAKVYGEKEDYTEAIKIAEDLLLKYPDFRDAPSVLIFVGAIYRFNLDAPEKSLEYFQKIVSKHPLSLESYDALVYQADYYMKKGEKDKARNIYESYLNVFKTKYPDKYYEHQVVKKIQAKLK